ncbi:MAG: M23 family metallopeptidase, partial [Bacteroidales bacterium]|nr:M23 family metallopeptidase [Bacteroidales bacterium]
IEYMKAPVSHIKRIYRRWFTDWKTKYRVVVTDQSYHEKLSWNLSRTQLWTTVGLFVLVTMVITACLILFTPLRQFVPGYTREELTHQVYNSRVKLDSLQNCLEGQTVMLRLMQAAIAGKVPMAPATVMKDSLKDYTNVVYRRSLADSLLRKEIEAADPYAVNAMQAADDRKSLADNWMFYAPVTGKCLRAFDARSFTGIEVETRPNESVKATMAGHVVYADWSPESGYVLVLQHENHLISIYARNTAILKMPGEYVEAGEVVAMTGTSLYFELWYNGFPMNPQNYVNF